MGGKYRETVTRVIISRKGRVRGKKRGYDSVEKHKGLATKRRVENKPLQLPNFLGKSTIRGNNEGGGHKKKKNRQKCRLTKMTQRSRVTGKKSNAPTKRGEKGK